VIQFSEPLILRLAPGANTGYFAGLASTYNVDRHGERVIPGAFAKTIAALKAGTQRIALLHMHQPTQVIGGVTSAEETDEGLEVEGSIVLGAPIADRAHQLLQANAAGLSVGFAAPTEGVNFRRDANGKKAYHDVDLMEISVVGVPSNRQSIVHTVRGLGDDITPGEFERLLRDGELPALPRRLAAKMTRACFGILDADSDEPDSAELAALNAAIARTINNLKSPR
jgi:HK97 family phage prohead protease